MTFISYIDPSYWSLVIQLVIGAFVTSIVTVKLWWNRAVDLLAGLFGRRSGD
jgi:hypothetical protein